MIQSGISQQITAGNGVTIVLSNEWKRRMHYYTQTQERMATVGCWIARGFLTLTDAFARGEGKATQVINNSGNDRLILLGDFNRRTEVKSMGNSLTGNNIETRCN
jgi:hypothetical protein